jgi:hypothetical protein
MSKPDTSGMGTISQTSFFALLPDTYWVELRPGMNHKPFQAGQRFLVIEEDKRLGCLLCWKDGIPPKMWPLTRGTLIDPKHVQEVSDHEHHVSTNHETRPTRRQDRSVLDQASH